MACIRFLESGNLKTEEEYLCLNSTIMLHFRVAVRQGKRLNANTPSSGGQEAVRIVLPAHYPCTMTALLGFQYRIEIVNKQMNLLYNNSHAHRLLHIILQILVLGRQSSLAECPPYTPYESLGFFLLMFA